MAHDQTAARGRQGRPWVVPPGNLSATLVLKPDCTMAQAAQRSFVAANALFAALATYISPDRLSLKWPNDVLLDGGKIAGILLESSGTAQSLNWLSIGFGVNLEHAPQGLSDAAFPPTSLYDAGGDLIAAEDFLTTLACTYATQEAKLVAMGFGRIRQDWLQRAARLGDVITARTPKTTMTGVFTTINAEGHLILDTADGTQEIPAADVYFD